MTRRRIAALSFAAALAFAGATATTASAAYHLNMVTEIHQGPGTTDGDYVELQAYAVGQNLVGGHYVATYDGGGNILTQTLLTNVASGADQATILVANSTGAPAGADITSPTLNVVNTGGYVCFTETVLTTGVDCVAYGNVAGQPSTSPSGTPAGPALGLNNNQSLSRITTKGCATALDPADDTNNSAADFAIAAPSPRGNAMAPTEVVCPPTQPGGGNDAKPKKKCKKPKKKAKKGASAAAKCKKKKPKKK